MKCRYPIEVPIPGQKRYILAPCNKCPECLARKKQQWTHRIQCEQRYSGYSYAWFITLSYNDKFLPYESFRYRSHGVPINPVSTGESLLNPYDLRKFIERLRHLIDDGFSYFAVGEYGDPSLTKRPHFHLILFCNKNWSTMKDFTDVAWSRLVAESRHERYLRQNQSKKIGAAIKRCSLLMKNRESFGRTQVRSVYYRRICYCAKYVSKQFGQDEVVPPFYTCSKGLGKCFLQSDEARSIKMNNQHYAYTSNGLPTALSRYYSHRLFSSSQMDAFNLSMLDADSIPDEIVGDFDAVSTWFHQKALEEKFKRRTFLLRYHGVRLL